LVVNGEPRTVVADPASPLLWALRDEVGDQSHLARTGARLDAAGVRRALDDHDAQRVDHRR
jgi:aerobic-type carbon monoxide dehydrogenase small subunit (CoxS/CutS family)